MSQRNPMNERYTSEEHTGKTRKSAASAKPKTKAASSVRIAPTKQTKTKQQKKAERKAAQAKQNELDRKYYNPPTEEYKRLKRIWWGCLIGAIVSTALSWFARSWQPVELSYIFLALAYVLIIAAFYVDFSKIRRVRRAYQEEMQARHSKEARAEQKQQKAAERAQKAAAAEAYEESKAEEAEKAKKPGMFSSLFKSGSKKSDKE